MKPEQISTDARVRGNGLEDVVAATTRLSDVDGEAGRLILAGAPVEDLAGSVTFEDAVHLLWWARLPSDEEREKVRAALGEAREIAFERLGDLGDALALPDGMDALRAATSHLVATEDARLSGSGSGSTSDRASRERFVGSLRVIGAIAVFAAAWARQSASPVRPDPGASHAADYLRMVTGHAPRSEEVDALDAYLVTVIDHGMNASTFTARVVASTESDLVSAIVGAIGALKGRLHGGAPGPVLDMLDAIGTAENARGWIDQALARGERIMGMGHRVYRVRDPRAFVLERAVSALEAARSRAAREDSRSRADSGSGGRLELARAVEREAEAILAARHPERALRANVEFYTAILLEAIGLPRTLFTPTFAVGRAAGWCAHVEEQRLTGRLIRPKSRYVKA